MPESHMMVFRFNLTPTPICWISLGSLSRIRNRIEYQALSMLNLIAWWLTMSAGVVGIPVIGIVMLLAVHYLPQRQRREPVSDVLLMGFLLIVTLSSVSILNEHVVKPGFHVFRPNIIGLAGNPPEQPALKISAAAFYALPDKDTRSDYLSGVLNAPDYNGPRLQPLVQRHWIHETGYSFPSGHTTAAMVLASFFLALALGRCSGRQLIPYLILPLWVLLVAWSRIVLQVHTPMDVLAGGVQGLIVGLLAWGIYLRLKPVRKESL